MNTPNKQAELEKEIERRLTCPYCKKKLNKEWKCFHKENDKGIPLEYKISYDYLDKLQAELKGIKETITEKGLVKLDDVMKIIDDIEVKPKDNSITRFTPYIYSEELKAKLQKILHSQTEQSEEDGCLKDNSLSKSDSPPKEIK